MELDCNFYRTFDGYACVVDKIRGSNFKKVRVNGQHCEGKSNNDVKLCDFKADETFLKFPGIGNIFPNLEIFSFWNLNLDNISTKNLRQFSNLRQLWIGNKKNIKVSSEWFKNNPKLTLISFVRYPPERIDDNSPGYQITAEQYDELKTKYEDIYKKFSSLDKQKKKLDKKNVELKEKVNHHENEFAKMDKQKAAGARLFTNTQQFEGKFTNNKITSNFIYVTNDLMKKMMEAIKTSEG